MAAQTISTPAPATSGFSVAYLIECQYQDQDTNPAVLPYYNSNNPQIPLNGQGGNGAPQATQRQGFCVIQAKAGIAAATGTQVTPSVDSGWTALAVVIVANGATTVTSGNISVPVGVPQISSLLQMMQTGSTIYAVDTSTSANTITLALTPAVTSYTDGEPIRFKAANSNTGACTINWGGGSIALNGANAALQGGEIIAAKQYEAAYNSTTGTAILIGQTAGALQIAPATQPAHAVQFGQVQQNYAWNHGFSAITSSGNFTVPANVYFLRYRVWGAGAGSGGVGSANNGSAGGGGAGGFAEGIMAVTPGQVIAATIGAAGTAGGTGGAGTAGGTTSFGSISATGGAAGQANTTTGGNSGGGGVGSGGQNNLTGGSGSTGGPGASAGGCGGTSSCGGAGGGGAVGQGAGGAVPGGGGGGSGGTGANAGAAGARGQVNLEW